MFKTQVLTACVLVPLLLQAEVEQVDIGSWRSSPPVMLQAGDLTFRRDNGVWSWFFIQASRREKRFSHVGIVVAGGENPKIVHADASELTGVGCVRMQTWGDFFAESLDGAVYRYVGEKDVREGFAREAMRRIGVPFDTGFDIASTNKLYCSELVREVVNASAGRELIGTTTLADQKRMVTVDDCYASNMVKIADVHKSKISENTPLRGLTAF